MKNQLDVLVGPERIIVITATEGTTAAIARDANRSARRSAGPFVAGLIIALCSLLGLAWWMR
jgi:hypothetical protein